MGDIIVVLLCAVIVSLVAKIMHPNRYAMNSYVSVILGVLSALAFQVIILFGAIEKGSIIGFTCMIFFIALIIALYGQFKS